MTYNVGQTIHAEYLHELPDTAEVRRVGPYQWEITALPEPSEAEKLAEELKQGFSYLDQNDRELLATWILERFERKHAQGDYVLDGEGDRWFPLQGGYALRGRGFPWALFEIREKYGIDSLSPIR